MAHRAVRLIERWTSRDSGGVIRRGVLRETGRERHRRRWDIRGDRVREPERDDDQHCEKSRALHETLPLAAAAPTDQREQTEDRGTDIENDRDLLETLS